MMIVCVECNGSGIDHSATGESMRQLREAEGLSLRALAKRMSLSPSYLSDLEHGRRHWNERLVTSYKHGIGPTTGAGR